MLHNLIYYTAVEIRLQMCSQAGKETKHHIVPNYYLEETC